MLKINKNYKEMRLGFAALIYAFVLFLVLSSQLFSFERDNWSFWYFFTNQSNILVMLWLIAYGIGTFVDGKLKRIAECNTVITAVTVYISITFLIVATVLEPFYTGKFEPLNSFFAHFSSAIVMWVYFFAVKGWGSLKYKQAFLILIYPLAYTFASLIIGSSVNFSAWTEIVDGEKIVHDAVPAYCYDFINPNSYPNVGIYIVVIVVLAGIFGGFGCLLIKFKRFLTKHYYAAAEAEISAMSGSGGSSHSNANVIEVSEQQINTFLAILDKNPPSLHDDNVKDSKDTKGNKGSVCNDKATKDTKDSDNKEI